MQEFQGIFIVFRHYRVSGDLLYLILYHCFHFQTQLARTHSVSTQVSSDAVSTQGPTDALKTQAATDAVTTESPTSTTGIGKLDRLLYFLFIELKRR